MTEEHTRNKPSRTFTIKPDNLAFLLRFARHRDLSVSRLLDEVIETFRDRHDPTYQKRRG